MAQAYPYFYRGKETTRQDKCRASMPLDRPRIWLDVNELCREMEGAPVYLFSQGDVVNDSNGADVALYDGMEVPVFDDDYDLEGNPDALLADGVILKNTLGEYPWVKWLIRLNRTGIDEKNRDSYFYHMSDLQ